MLDYRLATAGLPRDYRRSGFSREAFAVCLEKIAAKTERRPAAPTGRGIVPKPSYHEGKMNLNRPPHNRHLTTPINVASTAKSPSYPSRRLARQKRILHRLNQASCKQE
jgi:hypothetical protein